MNQDNLRELLTQLHTRLTHTGSLDADARRQLTAVMHDIEHALARSDVAAAPDAPRLESLAVRFEAEHPAVADLLRRLVDALAKAGI